MPTTKARGKSAAIQNNGAHCMNIPTTSTALLKIESVVPSLSRKPNKSIYRSYSTLSSGYLNKTIESRSDFEKKKFNYPNAANTQNGFWRIQRTAKEKDKLPDRINLDRRGLTALPIIDDEPQLRLLSLQHNLINSFYVPECPKPEIVEEKKPPSVEPNKKFEQLKPLSNQIPRVNKPHHLIVQKSVTSRSLHMNNNVVNKYASPLGPVSISAHNIMKNSFIQKSVLLHAKEKYVFRKSNSFINNYSQHLAASKIHLGRLMNNKNSNMMSSFSSDSTPELEIKPSSSADSLIIKNESFPGIADSLQNLVFLDLYDNQIEKVCTLDGLKSLTVLLLGKNRIIDISGIVSVKKTLRVLDLHGNKITNISQKICQLQELKSLNLAGNCLKHVLVDDFKGLFNLRELNLKRNKIKRIHGFDDLRNLERLWLCHNDLQKVEDMSSIAKAINLKEVTIENNPVSLGGDCVSFLVSYLPSLVLLSQMQVTEQVRRAAMAWRKSKETSDTNYSHLSNDVCQSIRREEVISNARTNWELIRSQQQVNKSSSFIQKSLKNTSQLQVPISEIEVDIYSNLSDNIQIDRKLIRQKTVTNRIKTQKKPVKTKTSSSQENLPTTSDSGQIQEEFFRLPPILAPFLDQNSLTRQNNSSGSSLGPNIDSSSSYFSSDNEDAPKKKSKPSGNKKKHAPEKVVVQQTEEEEEVSLSPEVVLPKKEKIVDNHISFLKPITPPKPIPEIITPCPAEISVDEKKSDDKIPLETFSAPITNADEDQSDKTSNLSTNSVNTASESSFPANGSDDSKSQRSKNSIPTRKYNSPLIRAQTAKSINVYTPTNSHQNLVKNQKTLSNTNEREREQGGDYLIEICGRYLNVYGAGAIKFIDRQWNTQKANDVHTFKFSYVNFNSIATVLSKIKARFPNADNFVFQETNINSLGQLNALAEIQGISTLVIDPEGNLVCTKNWRLYAIYRLSHWGIKTINGVDVTEEEIEEAQKTYSGLSDLVLWSLPETLLEPLLARLRLDDSCTASKMTAKQWLMQAEPSLKIVVGKEALQCKKTTNNQDETVIRQRGKNYFSIMMENTCNAVEKLQKLETLWPNLLVEMIRNTLLDYSQIDVYVKNLMSETQ